MIVDCERCPGQHLSPPACPSCVVRLLFDTVPGRAEGAPPVDLVLAPTAHPVEVELVRRTDDLGRPLDAREQRAVAVLTAGGLLAGSDGGRGGTQRRGRGTGGRVRTA